MKRPISRLLLVEPNTLVRRTVAGVSRALEMADISEASTYEGARSMLRQRPFEGLIIALAEDDGGIELVEEVRAGNARTASDCPIIVMVGRCDTALAQSLRAFGVRRVILKPFKVKTVLESVAQVVQSTACLAS